MPGPRMPGSPQTGTTSLHFQPISEFPGKGPVGTLEGCRGWHHSRHGYISSNRLLLDLAITSPAAL